MADTSSSKPSLKVGILFIGPGIQLLDMSAVDLLCMCTPSYITAVALSDVPLVDTQEFEFLYIAEGGAGTHAQMSSGAKVLVTHSFESAGKLDYLLIPGSEPKYLPSPAELAFIRAKFSEIRVVFSICTGIFPLVRSGVLSGKRATGPRMFLPQLREIAPDVQWTEKRWEVDAEGKVWSSGVVTNGLDAVAAYIRKTFTPQLAKAVFFISDFGEREQLYETEA